MDFIKDYWIIAILAFIGIVIVIIEKLFKETTKGKYYVGVFLIISLVLNFYQNIKEGNSTKKAIEEFTDIIYNTSHNIGVKELPGFTISSIIKISKVDSSKRKYIYDAGKDLSRNRVSIYLDHEDNLVFSIIDRNGTPNTVTVEKKLHTFTYNDALFVHCQYGYESGVSFMRVTINGRHYPNRYFKRRLKIPKDIQKQEGVLMTNLEKTDFAKAQFSMLSIAHVAFSDKMISDTDDAFNKYLTSMGWE